ncbi:hypothetical protein ASD91_26010 [Pseudomonas sp. Root68]|nr:hypothetical protein ASD91_26010 [Pseudomonas sp. Root68]
MQRGCDLLIFDNVEGCGILTMSKGAENQDQKIAACGSSYRGNAFSRKRLVGHKAAIVGTPPGPSSLPQKSKDRAAHTTASLLTTHQAER